MTPEEIDTLGNQLIEIISKYTVPGSRTWSSLVDPIRKLVEAANKHVPPTAYVPRDEVTEGYYSARYTKGKKRMPILVLKNRGVYLIGSNIPLAVQSFTDFLPLNVGEVNQNA